MSSKGQVVIPKAVRDRYRVAVGDTLDVIERPDGILLAIAPSTKAKTLAEALARIQAAVQYDGPWIDESEWPAAIEAMFRDRQDEWKP